MSASDAVYEYVREQILNGTVGSGELITEGQFAAAMHVSRTPVREAFLRLEVEGWLKLYPKRGALVVPVQPDEKEQVFEARHLIESHAVGTIAADAARTGGLTQALGGNIERMREAMDAGDLERFTTLDADFHLAIVEAAGNDILSDIYRGLRNRLRRMTTRSVWGDQARMAHIIEDHRNLADMIAQRDVAAFSRDLIHHMSTAHDRSSGRHPRLHDQLW